MKCHPVEIWVADRLISCLRVQESGAFRQPQLMFTGSHDQMKSLRLVLGCFSFPDLASGRNRPIISSSPALTMCQPHVATMLIRIFPIMCDHGRITRVLSALLCQHRASLRGCARFLWLCRQGSHRKHWCAVPQVLEVRV